jgi:hypothetical protein
VANQFGSLFGAIPAASGADPGGAEKRSGVSERTIRRLETAVPVLRGVLHLLGVYGDRMPDDPATLAALYRSTLAGRRMIILLDNATSAAQVRQLLPGVPGCLVLVTSRRRLLGLDGAESLTVPLMSTVEGSELLLTMAGADRAREADPGLIDRLVALCGHLPLAITLAAARLRARPCWSLTHLVERLVDQRHRLAELTAGDRSVAAAFALSYAALDEPHQRMFRLLGLHSGPDCDLATAATLAGLDPVDAARLIDELLDTHLLEQRAPNRVAMHDLVQVYAAGIAEAERLRAAG